MIRSFLTIIFLLIALHLCLSALGFKKTIPNLLQRFSRRMFYYISNSFVIFIRSLAAGSWQGFVAAWRANWRNLPPLPPIRHQPRTR